VENIEYVDNEPCVAMLSRRPGGVFAMIEEEIHTPGGSEANWLAKLYQVHAASTPCSLTPHARSAHGGAGWAFSVR